MCTTAPAETLERHWPIFISRPSLVETSAVLGVTTFWLRYLPLELPYTTDVCIYTFVSTVHGNTSQHCTLKIHALFQPPDAFHGMTQRNPTLGAQECETRYLRLRLGTV